MDKLWVVIPAAGLGRRLPGDVPKQYLELAGRTVIEWSVQHFLDRVDIEGVIVAISNDDRYFSTISLSRCEKISHVIGGSERSDSVLNGVNALRASERDWVLVHDAARPCLHKDDLQKLILEVRAGEVGGLLAAPVADTLKMADENQNVLATQNRERLWRAFTPQMFRVGTLRRALVGLTEPATDEAAAIERLGLKPQLVQGRSDNIKITVPEDLALAETILRRRSS